MAHLYKASIWQGTSKKWYVGDVEDLGHGSGAWWIPSRILNTTPANFVQLLIDQFKVSKIVYNKDKDFLFFYWDRESDARKYKNWINKKAREVNFIF
jgi:hypothetical protein